ncbi:hypothetical protein E2C01_034344 [Portunus trituberculatus]|uniref:Endonuclease/exonuclease/phosphatase domain-containing protein n=1 Tax=Portunus trituberculatus TaxID=210409 RepID=A0A5B7F5Z4_PORTR|nr:hypothetical protein [Portunus trituberculatus]
MNRPVNMLADINANHQFLGYTSSNTKGRQINTLIQHRTLQHIGPHFPTSYTRNRGTTPDIILTNFKIHHNTYITQGPITTSDHIPIILDISTAPIVIPAFPRPILSKANWEKVTHDLQTSITQPDLQHASLEEIDTAIDK